MTLKLDRAPLATRQVLAIRADIGRPVQIGASDQGVRRYIPITGGEFTGAEIRGRVLPGGADWQLERADGVTEIDAHYAIEADDGAIIIVRNRGIADRTGDAPYVRTTPRFQAPVGTHDWLNRRLFVGTIVPARDFSHVMVSVFQVD